MDEGDNRGGQKPPTRAEEEEGDGDQQPEPPRRPKHEGEDTRTNTIERNGERSVTDGTALAQQAVYAVLDNDSCTNTTTACVTKSDLATRFLPGQVGAILLNGLDWTTQKGWYIDLKTGVSNERIVGQPIIAGNALLFITLQTIGDVQGCTSESRGHVYAVDRNSGGIYRFQIIDSNRDGDINAGDHVSALPSNVIQLNFEQALGIGKLLVTGGGDGIIALPGADNEPVTTVTIRGRVRWRQFFRR